MPTGMHDPGNLGAERECCLLGDGKRVEISSKGNGATIWIAREVGYYTRRADSATFNSGGGQLPFQKCCGHEFLVR